MTFKRVAASVAIASQLAACGGTEHFEHAMQSNVGLTEQSLVDKLGPPDTTYKLENDDSGMRYLTWVKTGSAASSNSESPRCRMTFKVGPNSIVQAYSYDGNACNDGRSSGPGWWDVVGTVLVIAATGGLLLLGVGR
ncbi:hypothetical protein [Vineibacter terrae]|uniref:hypothetical protein n=1 Tax=Vineibacter terrae TaxID=2586908 RepID=UPI002E30E191|nr:hypothetical protein [Vineibacter terrae]HEX2886902.1 hypothetical protein [Vineibacter terrae]